MDQKSIAYIKTLELWKQLLDKGIPFKRKTEKVTTLTYNVQEIMEQDVFYKADYAYVDSAIFNDLSNSAKLMVCDIVVNLKENNPLWYFDHRKNERKSKIITELRKKEILFKTGTTEIHYVNPFKIRKGKIGRVISLTYLNIENAKRVTTDHIKPLRFDDKVRINGKDFIDHT